MTNAKVTLRNIGPFEQAELTIKPLTILIGKNSVGKSLLTYLIWSLMFTPDLDKLLDEVTTKPEVHELAKAILDKIKSGKQPEELRELIKQYIETLPEAVASQVEKTLQAVFMTKPWELIRKGESEASILIEGSGAAMEISLSREGVKARYIKQYTEFIEKLKTEVPKPGQLRVLYEKIIEEGNVTNMGDLVSIIIKLLAHYICIVFNPFFIVPPICSEFFAALFPDSRAGISRVLLKPYIFPTIVKGIPYPDEQFVKVYYKLTEDASKRPRNLDIIKPLLRELGCDLNITLEGGVYTIYLKMWNGKRLHFSQAPSGIREVLTTALALANHEEPYIVIIEEPEAHLHPSAQIAFAKLVANAVNRGKTVIITTHSPTLLAIFNNLIMASRLKQEKLKELGITKNQVLKPYKVAAYLLKADETKGATTVEQLHVDEEGIPEDEFAKVDEELANQRASIMLRQYEENRPGRTH
ncbi:AAA family ATPase [Vulcanisaeta thermophila]|uniref:AAA family ATPase n=1 Tax=Vulcanisaeta thermophila TaxID=867917 RepID=UPI0008537FE7|nr:AAA family ATPase [Vulcanisaeta thermophila]